MTQNYRLKTIKKFQEIKLKEKGSQFIAQAYPVENSGNAEEIIETIKKKFFDASHHCFAYKIIDDSKKFTDSGEPSGTAGIRILGAIEHFDLTNILVVVIRYFGGTKLGVGPLGKSYYNSAYSVLENSEIISKLLYKKVSIVIDFSLTSHLHRILSNNSAKIVNSDYSEKLRIDALIPLESIKNIETELIELTRGKAELKFNEEIFL